MVVIPNLNDYDINVLIALGNKTNDTFKYNQIKLTIVDKLLILNKPMFFLINKFKVSDGILKEVYAEIITMKMKDNSYDIEDIIVDEVLKLASLDALVYYGADSHSLDFRKRCKEEFDNRAREIEDKIELNKKKNLGKVKLKRKGD